MKQHPVYKSLKVTFETWQKLTRIAAQTGEPRTKLVERLAVEEESRRATIAITTKSATSAEIET